MRITRRGWLHGLAAGLLSMLSSSLGARRRAAANEGARQDRWRTEGGAAFGAGTLVGLVADGAAGLRLAAGARSGSYLSSAYQAAFRFNALGTRWRADLPAGAGLQLELRVASGGLWTTWLPILPLGHGPGQTAEQGAELLFAPGEQIQLRAVLSAGSAGRPTLAWIEVIYIDSTAGPDATTAARLAAQGTVSKAGLARPPIISRVAWGCPEAYSSELWPPVYQRTVKAIVHHTAAPAEGQDQAEVVRAIWQYHARTLGWGDIGYNYLIDQQGKIYEGRFGGDDVVAGHAFCFNWGSTGVALLGDFTSADAPKAAQDALVQFLAWKCAQRQIDPLGHGFFVQKDLDNLTSHRDGNGSCGVSTACPGDHLYGRMLSVRTAVAALVRDNAATYGVAWDSHNTPAQMLPGERASVRVQVRNVGLLVWRRDITSSVRLGYHWYRADGSQYVQSQEDDLRGRLPYDNVGYQQSATIDTAVVAPRDLGTYTLKWDMVHEGFTWFSAEPTSRTLDVSVGVRLPQLQAVPAKLTFFTAQGRDPGSQTIDVRNSGPGTFAWQTSVAASPIGWLQIAPAAADRPGQLTVFARPGGLEPGTYQGRLMIAASSTFAVENSPLAVDVNLVVLPRQNDRYLPTVIKGG